MTNPLFQHRHYVAIAGLLAELNQSHTPDIVRMAFASLFQRDNSRFDWDRFMDAANGEPRGRDKVRS